MKYLEALAAVVFIALLTVSVMACEAEPFPNPTPAALAVTPRPTPNRIPSETPGPTATPLPATMVPAAPAASTEPMLNLSWVQDGLAYIEQQALGYLHEIRGKHQSLYEDVMRVGWLQDDIGEGERTLLCILATVDESATAEAMFNATNPEGAAKDFGPCSRISSPLPEALRSQVKFVEESPPTGAGSSADRAALVALYEATGGKESWKNNSNWSSDIPIGRWAGVASDLDGRVISLDLSNNGLSGQIPPELGSFSYLVSLNLSNNQLTGPIPPELGSLSNLEHLQLQGNRLDASLPPELGNLAALQSLNLSDNSLTGEIPPELGNLAALQSLNLSDNSLTGEIPPELGNLAALQSLNLSDNSLTGEIPPELGNLSNLGWVSLLRGNQFTSCLAQDVHRLLSRVAAYEMLFLALGPCTGKDEVLTADGEPMVYNDNVFVLPVAGDLVEDAPLVPFDYVESFYQHFEDAFDFLVVVTNLYYFEVRGNEDFDPTYWRVSNDVQGIGLRTFSRYRQDGPTRRLQGMVRLNYVNYVVQRRVLLHELMHRWANFIVPDTGGHWGFASANGMVGGFDIADLIDLGQGRYAVRGVYRGGGTFNPTVHGPDWYSPIELYVAGLIPPEEVPDLWVGEEVEWYRDETGRVELAEGRYRVFKPGKVRTVTIEDIIAEHGKRVPDVSRSQKDFRAAVIFLIDDNHPAIRWQLDQLSNDVAAFSFPGTKDDLLINFYEATGGRATISMDGLAQFRKSGR